MTPPEEALRLTLVADTADTTAVTSTGSIGVNAPDAVAHEGLRLLRRVRHATDRVSSIPSDHNAPRSVADARPSPLLEFLPIRQLIAEVDAAGPRRWLLRGVWPGGDYGVASGVPKAQKTWCAADLAVSVATGTPWLGEIPVDDPGPVVMFAGEGGKPNIVRRLRAMAEARQVTLDDLPIVVVARAPQLKSSEHLKQIEDALGRIRPRLVIIDPLYLAAGGATGSDLYAMGELLQGIQHCCQAANAALLVIHHDNRKSGKSDDGVGRMSGAGPAEWGRVLISLAVTGREQESATRPGETCVRTRLTFIGGEIAGRVLHVERHVWSDDPDDLNAPLHVETVALPSTDDSEAAASRHEAEPALDRQLLDALCRLGQAAGWRAIRAEIPPDADGEKPVRETISKRLNALKDSGRVIATERKGKATLWAVARVEAAPKADGDL